MLYKMMQCNTCVSILSTNFTNGYYSEILGSDMLNNPLEDSVLENGDVYMELEFSI